MAAGVTAGTSEFSCADCGTAAESHFGMAPSLALGYSVSRHLALVLNLDGTVAAHDGIRERNGYTTLGVVLFPIPSAPLALHVGGGLSRYHQDIPRPGDTRDGLGTTGFGWRVGIGYDLAVTQSLALVPGVEFLGAADSELRLDDADSGYSASHHTLAASLRIVWNFTATPFALTPGR